MSRALGLLRGFSSLRKATEMRFHAVLPAGDSSVALCSDGHIRYSTLGGLVEPKLARSSDDDIRRYYQRFTNIDWGDFLPKLNPVITRNLNPNPVHRRHLINAYNFCVSPDDAVAHNRSQAIGVRCRYLSLL